MTSLCTSLLLAYLVESGGPMLCGKNNDSSDCPVKFMHLEDPSEFFHWLKKDDSGKHTATAYHQQEG
jgi:hypothetical protein